MTRPSLSLIYGSRPAGHEWRADQDYDADIGGGETIRRTGCIRCLQCGVLAYWEPYDRRYYVDKTRYTYRDVLASCDEERVQLDSDAAERLRIAEECS